MRTIDDIKDQYAKEQEYESWHYMLYLCTTSASYIPELEKHINEVCHRYATECQDELKKKIAVGDKLKAIDACIMNNSKREALIIGKEYDVLDVDEEDKSIMIESEIGEHTFDIDELSEFFESEPTPSREAEYRELLENCKVEFEQFRSAFGQGSNMIQEIETLLKK